MAQTAMMRVIKSFTYRGATQEWGNTYHFVPGEPLEDAEWVTLINQVTSAELLVLPATVTIERTVGYSPGSTVARIEHPDGRTGTFTAAGTPQAPGDCAALIRYTTTQKTSRGHPIYLFNYYHAPHLASTGPDDLLAAHKTALETYAGKWIAGFSDGVRLYQRCGPRGAVAQTHRVEDWVTHRDFPR